MSVGRVLQINVSQGGVPKLPVPSARITRAGVEGDRQRAVTVHGGPHRAVSILGIEVIRRVAAEGHSIAPGTVGENLTVEGLGADVSTLPPGTRLAIGDTAVLELASPTNPCETIRGSFRDGRFGRLGVATHPADSRMYARVVVEGFVRPGDPIRVSPPLDDSAARYLIANRLDEAEAASSVLLWRAASASGASLAVIDDGELAIAAAPDLPGPVFNCGLGFVNLPHLVDRATAHFTRHGVTGWVLAEEPPWADATAEWTLARYAGDPTEVHEPDGRTNDDVDVRELARDEIGPWGAVLAAAGGMEPATADAWRGLEEPLAAAVHHHRFVAFVHGRAAAAASVSTYHRAAWCRAAVVLPAFRGRGLQRLLLAARAERAARLGCDLIGASAAKDGASAANLERTGFRRVATRGAYRYDGRGRDGAHISSPHTGMTT